MNNDSNNITKTFRKDDRLEKVLNELNEELQNVFSKNLQLPQKPIVLIMGCARSGSTLLLQYLSQSGLFSYPTNLIARFYKNPYLGIKLQQALLDFDPLNQLDFKIGKQDFSSNLGKTFGVLAPSEFWYFWRHYFSFGKTGKISNKALSKVNINSFLKQLSSFEKLTNKALVMKGMMLNEHIPFLYKNYNKFIFLNIERNPFYNAQSLLLAREKYFSNREKWYSFKPDQYKLLKEKSPIEQVVGQVYYSNKNVREGLEKIPNKITIQYEDFCKNPYAILELLVSKMNSLGENLDIETIDNHFRKIVFNCKDQIKMSDSDTHEMNNILKKYALLDV